MILHYLFHLVLTSAESLLLIVETERTVIFREYFEVDDYPVYMPKINFILVNEDQEEIRETALLMDEFEMEVEPSKILIKAPNSFLEKISTSFFFIEVEFGSEKKLTKLNYIYGKEKGISPQFFIFDKSKVFGHFSKLRIKRERLFADVIKKIEASEDESLRIKAWFKEFEYIARHTLIKY